MFDLLRFNQNYSCQTGLKQILEFRTSFQQYFYLAYLVDFFWTKHVTTAELLEKETEAFLIWPCKKEQHSWFRIFGFLFYTKILEHWKNSNLLLHSHRVIDHSVNNHAVNNQSIERIFFLSYFKIWVIVSFLFDPWKGRAPVNISNWKKKDGCLLNLSSYIAFTCSAL